MSLRNAGFLMLLSYEDVRGTYAKEFLAQSCGKEAKPATFAGSKTFPVQVL